MPDVYGLRGAHRHRRRSTFGAIVADTCSGARLRRDPDGAALAARAPPRCLEFAALTPTRPPHARRQPLATATSRLGNAHRGASAASALWRSSSVTAASTLGAAARARSRRARICRCAPPERWSPSVVATGVSRHRLRASAARHGEWGRFLLRAAPACARAAACNAVASDRTRQALGQATCAHVAARREHVLATESCGLLTTRRRQPADSPVPPTPSAVQSGVALGLCGCVADSPPRVRPRRRNSSHRHGGEGFGCAAASVDECREPELALVGAPRARSGGSRRATPGQRPADRRRAREVRRVPGRRLGGHGQSSRWSSGSVERAAVLRVVAALARRGRRARPRVPRLAALLARCARLPASTGCDRSIVRWTAATTDRRLTTGTLGP